MEIFLNDQKKIKSIQSEIEIDQQCYGEFQYYYGMNDQMSQRKNKPVAQLHI